MLFKLSSCLFLKNIVRYWTVTMFCVIKFVLKSFKKKWFYSVFLSVVCVLIIMMTYLLIDGHNVYNTFVLSLFSVLVSCFSSTSYGLNILQLCLSLLLDVYFFLPFSCLTCRKWDKRRILAHHQQQRYSLQMEDRWTRQSQRRVYLLLLLKTKIV